MSDLSPAAQAVLRAAIDAHDEWDINDSIAAALRAAALYSYCPIDRRILMTIADELEGSNG